MRQALAALSVPARYGSADEPQLRDSAWLEARLQEARLEADRNKAGLTFDEARADRAYWGRLTESAVGAQLTASLGRRAEVLYWRDRGKEVDFVIERGAELTAIEVKSGRARESPVGLKTFSDATKGKAQPRIIGGDGQPVEDFLAALWARRSTV